jgi:hypothetical protein
MQISLRPFGAHKLEKKKILMPLLVKERLPYRFCAVKPNFRKTNQEEKRRKSELKEEE